MNLTIFSDSPILQTGYVMTITTGPIKDLNSATVTKTLIAGVL